MDRYLCIATTFLADRYCGREWPPSPARLFQSLLAGAKTGMYRHQSNVSDAALRALERLPAPEILAADARDLPPYTISVPNNDSDKLAREWAAGRHFDSAHLRTLKTIAPRQLPHTLGGMAHLYYFWKLTDEVVTTEVRQLVSFLHTFGWGVDMAYADSMLLDERAKLALMKKEGYSQYIPASEGPLLRDVAAPGYLNDLTEAYKSYCDRFSGRGINPATRATNYGQSRYTRLGNGQSPSARFLLRSLKNSDLWFAVPWTLGTRVAAWMRHATAEALRKEGYSSEKIDSYILGHGEEGHRRHISFVPVPTIRTVHGDGAIRRVMIVEPSDSDGVTTRLLQWKLSPTVLHKLVESNGLGRKTEPVCRLVETQYGDPVWPYYLPTEKRRVWHSVTPVILHGHNSEHGKFSLKKNRAAFVPGV